MNLTLLDPYRERDSFIHQLDARVKLVFVLAFILIINLTPIQAWPIYLVYLLAILAIVLWARISPVRVIRRSMLALPFALMAALGVPFVGEGRPVISTSLLAWRFAITDVGVLRFAIVMARSWLAVLVAVTLIVSTRFVDILVAMRSLGVPQVLTSIILLMYRYLYVLVDEAQRLMCARQARSAEPEEGRGGKSLVWQAQVTGRMIGTLFLRTYERSERIYQAMLARGFSGEIRTLRPPALSSRHLAYGGLSMAVLVAVVVLTNIYW